MQIICFIAALVVALRVSAAEPPLAEFGEPFNGSKIDIPWEVPTNSFQSTFRIYKVAKSELSPAQRQKLLGISQLGMNDTKRPTQEGVFVEKDVLSLASRNDDRSLVFVPSQGFLHLENNSFSTNYESVPGDTNALLAALALFKEMGIAPEADLAKSAQNSGYDVSFIKSTISKMDKATHSETNFLASMGVILKRTIDGIAVNGSESFVATFGSHGRIKSLEWTWRSIRLEREQKALTPTEILARFKSEVFTPLDQSGDFKHLTLKKIIPYYYEHPGSQSQSHLYPFLMLEGETENKSIVYFYCSAVGLSGSLQEKK